jgi:hypothetical protein
MVRMTRRRRGGLALLLLVFTAAFAAPARAGTYTVDVCALSSQQDAFAAYESPGMAAYSSCPGDQLTGITTGMVTRNVVPGSGSVPYWSSAWQVFSAPVGTSIERVSFDASIGKPYECNWDIGLFGWDDDALFEVATMIWGQPSGVLCGTGLPSFLEIGNVPVGHRKIRFGTRCANLGGCNTSWAAGTSARAWLSTRNVHVVVNDPVAPGVTAGGALWADGWHRGSQAIDYSASDNAGVAATSIIVDNGDPHVDWRACDFGRTAPCATALDDSYTVDTTSLADGDHTIRIGVMDVAGNQVPLTQRTVSVDNTAPVRLDDVVVAGGSGWRANNSFDLSWTNPAGQVAPIARAHYEICSGDATSCEPVAHRDGAGISSLGGITVPGPGEWVVRVWLEDAAGNVSAASASDPVTLRFDDVQPGAAEPAQPAGWLGAATAEEYRETISLAPGAVRPVSGVAGFSVTLDGSQPDATIDVAGEPVDQVLEDLPEGETVIRARAVSGAGVPSPQVGEARLRVDRSLPSLAVAGAPDPAAWRSNPVALHLTASDQPTLSGVDRIVYTLDGGSPVESTSAQADAEVSAEGIHTLVAWSVDRAGNRSPERELGFRIDRTAPLVAFEAPDPSDPRRVTAVAVDRASGVTAGVIEVRDADGGAWRRLSTRLIGDRLVAVLDDESPEIGAVQLRARAVDAAGNEGIGDRRLDGRVMTLALPLRFGTVLRAAATTTVPVARTSSACRSAVKTARTAGRPVPHRCMTTQERPIGTRTLVGHGRPVTLSGTLRAADGLPLAGSAVVISERLAASGAAERTLKVVRTDRLGRFRVVLAAGPSRTVTLRYAGDRLTRPGVSQVVLRVPARARMTASRSAVRNGERVTFRGSLLGGNVPRGGKLVALQAFYRRAWRTFAVVRADRRGRFAYTYRFEATTDTVRYRFRAQVRREAVYPFELGYGNQVAVTVRG